MLKEMGTITRERNVNKKFQRNGRNQIIILQRIY